MRLIEFDAKQLLRERGLAVPRGAIYDPAKPPVVEAGAIKAQMLSGGRGKSGLVKLASAEDFRASLDAVQAQMRTLGMEPLVLIEEPISIAREFYLCWRIDDVRQAFTLMFSQHGGVDIESQASTIAELVVDPLEGVRAHRVAKFLRDAGLDSRAIGPVTRFAVAAYRACEAEDIDFLEINPLALTTDGEVIAVDAKATLDDHAASRHSKWNSLLSAQLQASGMTPLEQRAIEASCTFIELQGNVAVLSTGAGLGMAVVDLLADAGLSAANFADASGGAPSQVFGTIRDLVYERATAPEVEGILMFFTLTATSLKSVVGTILDDIDRMPPPKPFVAGLIAAGAAEREMTLAEAQEAFRKRGYACETSPEAAVAALKQAIAARGTRATDEVSTRDQ